MAITLTTKKISTSPSAPRLSNVVSGDSGAVSDFSFIYDLAGYDKVKNGFPIIREIDGQTIKITNINWNNKPYFNRNGGNSNAMTVPILESGSILGAGYTDKETKKFIYYYPKLRKKWYNGTYSLLKTFNPTGSKDDKNGFTLPNCVGYVISRIIEIWKVAVDSGLIIKEGDVFKTASGREILGSIKFSDDSGKYWIDKGNNRGRPIPKYNAKLIYDEWYKGGEDTPGWYKNKELVYKTPFNSPLDIGPVPGALICWDADDGDSSGCGHIAFVEKVLNLGTPDECIIYSESGYDRAHLNNSQVISLHSLRKYDGETPYKQESKKCKGFLHSPICQLIGELPYITTSSPLNSGSAFNVDEKILELRGIGEPSTIVNKNPLIGDIVKINYFGYKDKNSEDHPINYINSTGRVVSIDPLSSNPFGVSIDGKNTASAYYKRNSLII